MGVIKYNIPQPWRRKYAMQKAQAKHRKEEWAFTDETWLKIWDDSGYKEHMGREVHQYCMVRKDHTEAWGPHNCIIVPRRLHMRKNFYEAMTDCEKTEWKNEHGVYVPPEAKEKYGEV